MEKLKKEADEATDQIVSGKDDIPMETLLALNREEGSHTKCCYKKMRMKDLTWQALQLKRGNYTETVHKGKNWAEWTDARKMIINTHNSEEAKRLFQIARDEKFKIA